MRVGIACSIFRLCLQLCICSWQQRSPEARVLTQLRAVGSKSSKLSTQKNVSTLGKLPTFIVEEHHEVLPYWFGKSAGAQQDLPVLIHFDAHPDLAMPSKPKGWTISGGSPGATASKAAQRWMRYNDEFIVGAVLEQRLRRMVWVFPAWDSQGPRHGRSKGPILTILRYGTTSKGSICECTWQPRHALTGASNHWDQNTEDELVQQQAEGCINDDEDDVDQNDCHLGTQRLALLQISEEDVLLHHKLLQSFTSLEVGPGQIPQIWLDIDEDHFAQDPTKWHGKVLGRKWVRKLDRFLGNSLCPKQAEAAGVATEKIERIGNAAMQMVVDTAIKYAQAPMTDETKKDLTRDDHPKNRQNPRAQLLGIEDHEFAEALAKTGVGDLLCTSQERGSADQAAVISFGSHLLQMFHGKNRLQLQILHGEGACLSTSMATQGANPHLHTCLSGANTKEVAKDTDFSTEAGLLAHSPVEVRRRVHHMGNVLRTMLVSAPSSLHNVDEASLSSAIHANVRLVSICRSVRDGYTPRESWHEIEGNLLSELDQWAEHSLRRSTNVIYDKNLLGGSYGWDAHATQMDSDLP